MVAVIPRNARVTIEQYLSVLDGQSDNTMPRLYGNKCMVTPTALPVLSPLLGMATKNLDPVPLAPEDQVKGTFSVATANALSLEIDGCKEQ